MESATSRQRTTTSRCKLNFDERIALKNVPLKAVILL